MPSKSLQSSILLFFIISSTLTFALLGAYVVYEHHQEMKESLRNSLKVLSEDVMKHELYDKDSEAIKDSFHLLESYHDAPFVALFDHLEFSIVQTPPSSELLQVTSRLPDGRLFVVSSTCKQVQIKTWALAMKMLAVFGTMLLLFVVIFSLFLNRLFLSLRCLVDFCQSSSREARSTPLCSGSSEVNELRLAIIDLMETNHLLCREKQNIFKEAAHEIKAPIAVLKARLSLFKQDDVFDKKEFVAQSEADINTISGKLKELLFLKEIEWDMQQKREHVPMQEQCSLMQQAFMPILEKKGLKMVSNFEEDFSLYIHKAAMQKVMQAIFENIFMHTKNHTTIETHVDSRNKSLTIVNAIGEKSDETLFSSHIGEQLIARLSEKIGYRYETSNDDKTFTTRITFLDDPDSCTL